MDISRQARGFVTRPSAKRADKLLSLSRNQPTTMTGLLAWHCYLKGHLFNPLNAELNPICYLLALLAHHFLHVSRIRVKSLTLKLLMSYIYIYIYI